MTIFWARYGKLNFKFWTFLTLTVESYEQYNENSASFFEPALNRFLQNHANFCPPCRYPIFSLNCQLHRIKWFVLHVKTLFWAIFSQIYQKNINLIFVTCPIPWLQSWNCSKFMDNFRRFLSLWGWSHPVASFKLS